MTRSSLPRKAASGPSGLTSCPYDVLDLVLRFANLPPQKLKELRLTCSTLRSAIDPLLFHRFGVDIHNLGDLYLINDTKSLNSKTKASENASDPSNKKYKLQSKSKKKGSQKEAWAYVRQFVRVLHITHDTANVALGGPGRHNAEVRNLIRGAIEDFLATFEHLSTVSILLTGKDLWGEFHGGLIESICDHRPDLNVTVDLKFAHKESNFLPFDPFEPDNLMIIGSLDNLTSLSLTRQGRIRPWESGKRHLPEAFLAAFAELISRSPNLRALEIDYRSFEQDSDTEPFRAGRGNSLDLDVLFDLVDSSKPPPRLQRLVARSVFLPRKKKHVERWFSNLTELKLDHDEKVERSSADLHRIREGWEALVQYGPKTTPVKMKMEISRGSMHYLQNMKGLGDTLKSLTLADPCYLEYFTATEHQQHPDFWMCLLPAFASLEVLKVKNQTRSRAGWWPLVEDNLPRCPSLRRLEIHPPLHLGEGFAHWVTLILKRYENLKALSIIPGSDGYFCASSLLGSGVTRVVSDGQTRKDLGLREGFQVRFQPPLASQYGEEEVIELAVGRTDTLETWKYVRKYKEYRQGSKFVCHQRTMRGPLPDSVLPPFKSPHTTPQARKSPRRRNRFSATVSCCTRAIKFPFTAVCIAGGWCVKRAKGLLKRKKPSSARCDGELVSDV